MSIHGGSFGERVRNMRIKAGVSQSVMADAIGCSKTNIVAIEGGRITNPSLRVAMAISAYFDISIYELYSLDLEQEKVMEYDPATGEKGCEPNLPDKYRKFHGKLAWLYNPWTGDKRDPRDIGSDVQGFLIV